MITSDSIKTTTDLFFLRVIENPEDIAISINKKHFTYSEIDILSNKFSNYLRIKKKNDQNESYKIQLPKNEWFIICVLAIWKCGKTLIDDDSLKQDQEINKFNFSVIGIKEIQEFKTNYHTYSEKTKTINVSGDDLAYLVLKEHNNSIIKTSISHDFFKDILFSLDYTKLELPDNNTIDSSLVIEEFLAEVFWRFKKGDTVLLELPEIKNKKLSFGLFYFGSQSTSQNNKNYRFLLDSAKFADAHDFSSVWLPERHFHEFGAIYPSPSVLGAAIATITDKIRIHSGSVVLPLHDTVRVAEQWSVVDKLSNGRVSLSIASGWHADDFVLIPENYENRYTIMYDQIKELKKLWTGKKISRKNGLGDQVSFKIFPKPIQEELPIWITSGGNPETFKKAGKIGANILTHLLGQDINTLKENISLYKEELKVNGHDQNNAKISLMLHTYIGTELSEVKKTVEIPFKNYLKSNLGLLKNLVQEKINQDRLDELIELAFERYWNTAALFGTIESCIPLLTKISEIGVTEIGCLIDFGIEENTVLNGLNHLNKLYKNVSQVTENIV
ncbi:MupA/Atu3671 family FMN-dependent luciferase-like monooxygenase [Aquimarina sp. RZ0]|uniref:MupA/Atu3671 family FMN-dependent luciferase-like monooxygenase n=1 Tax=Aquimarina sp. RZ0 TaxID=2607730 RepID=UPI0011F11CF1|nr:MupA/Atu3671 family FMN-dependent luciferase-like monooxygenase [Aquimarina sp. RZ0]KAA1242946.1 LLM class flavin-dependent oxidoreductase [Aquimarina sp. RZ0]